MSLKPPTFLSRRPWKQLGEILIFLFVMRWLSALYGFDLGDQIPALGIWLDTMGVAHALAQLPNPFVFRCPDILIPYGLPMLGGFVVSWVIAFFIKFLQLGEDIAGNLAGWVFLGVAFYSVVYLLKRLGIRRWIGFVCGLLFLMLPFVYGHMDFGSLGFGLMLVPLSVFADFILLDDLPARRPSSAAYLSPVLKVLLVRLVVPGIDWYVAVICLVGSAVLVWYSVGLRIIREPRAYLEHLKPGFIWLGTWVVGLLFWYVAMPRERLAEPFSIDYFRAQGVDLITLFIPRGEFWWGNLVKLPHIWNAFDFFGDGTSADYNYLGYAVLIGAVVAIVIVTRRKLWATKLGAVIVAAFACFIISLGPSLKIDSRRAAATKEASQISYEDYQMPARSAVASLPTSFIYKIYPITLMRAVYRWLIFTKVMLLLLFGWVLNELLAAKRTTWAVVLAGVAVLEFLPDIPGTAHMKMLNWQRYQSMKDTLLGGLKRDLKPGDRVLFFANVEEGDYLSSWLAPHLRIKSFNGSGDKNNYMATKFMPGVIQRLKRFDALQPQMINEYLLLALRTGVVDKIVIPYFSLRWDSQFSAEIMDTAWPEQTNRVSELRSQFAFIDTMKQVRAVKSTYFSILSVDTILGHRDRNFAGQLDSTVTFVNQQKKSALILVDAHLAPFRVYFPGRSSQVKDYRNTGIVEEAFGAGRPVIFLLTAYQRFFAPQKYTSFEDRLLRDKVFQTLDYRAYALTLPDYERMAFPTISEDQLARIQQYYDMHPDSLSAKDWTSLIDFERSDYAEQLGPGWYALERSGTNAYRWTGKQAAVLVRVPPVPPKEVVVTVFPVLDRIKRKAVRIQLFLNDVDVGDRVIDKGGEPMDFRFRVGAGMVGNKPLAKISIRLDKTIPPSANDSRELGIIVSRIGLEGGS